MKTTVHAPTPVPSRKGPPTHPAREVLVEVYPAPADLTQLEAARRMGFPLGTVNEIIRRKRASRLTRPSA